MSDSLISSMWKKVTGKKSQADAPPTPAPAPPPDPAPPRDALADGAKALRKPESVMERRMREAGMACGGKVKRMAAGGKVRGTGCATKGHGKGTMR